MRKPAVRNPSSDWGYLVDQSGRSVNLTAVDAYYLRVTCAVNDQPPPEFVCSLCERPAHPRSSSSAISFVHNKGMADGCELSSKASIHLSPQDKQKADLIKRAFFTERHLLETYFVMNKLCGVYHNGVRRLPPAEFEKAITVAADSEPWLLKAIDKYQISMRAVSGILIKPNDKHTIMWQMENGRSASLVKCISYDGLRYKDHKSGDAVTISINGFMCSNKIEESHPDIVQARLACVRLVERFNPALRNNYGLAQEFIAPSVGV